MTSAATRPLVTASTHSLPFEKLSPADFERLCYGLARREGYEALDHDGAAGQDEGCDIVAFRNGERVVFQCKRYSRLAPGQAEAAVGEVLALPEAERPARFVLVVAGTVSREARKRLRRRAGSLATEVWDRTALDDKVNAHPDLRRQFFSAGGAVQESSVFGTGNVVVAARISVRSPRPVPTPYGLN